MKNLDYICMAVAFVTAGISAMMWYGSGVHTWIWQLVCMIWIANSYFQTKRLEKLDK